MGHFGVFWRQRDICLGNCYHKNMFDIMLGISGAVLGAILGSFACCQAWRIRLKETKKQNPGQRSVCLHCHQQLKWYDNLPIISWLILKGRCRYCHKAIGSAEILSELGLACILPLVLLRFSSTLTHPAPLAILSLVILTIIITIFWILLIYDARWGRLPSNLLISSIVLSAVYFALQLNYSVSLMSQLANLAAGLGILAGIYFILYKISHETWVGGGDWLLGAAIALLLGDWWFALLELFIANILSLVGYATFHRRRHSHQIPLGPYLIMAWFLIFLLQDSLKLAL